MLWCCRTEAAGRRKPCTGLTDPAARFACATCTLCSACCTTLQERAKARPFVDRAVPPSTGEGEFGVVHKAMWYGTVVAAKVLKNTSEIALGDFRSEIEVLRKVGLGK